MCFSTPKHSSPLYPPNSQLIDSFQLACATDCALKLLNPFYGSLTQEISCPWSAVSKRMQCLAPISSNNELNCALVSEAVISQRNWDSSSQNRMSYWALLSFVFA